MDKKINTELFVDEINVAVKNNLTLRLQQPKEENIVMLFNAPWEDERVGYQKVIKVDGQYYLYYRSRMGFRNFSDSGIAQALCYAVSEDGITFERVNVGKVDFNGSKDNNILFTGVNAHNFTPFYDTNPDCLPQQRFKAVSSIQVHESMQEWNVGKLYGYVSQDGIDWKQIKPGPGIMETHPQEYSIYVMQHNRNDCRLRRFTVRKHGFASMHADYYEGEFITKPFILQNDTVYINYSTSAAGYLKVQVLDQNGLAIEGFTFNEAKEMFGDSLFEKLSWGEKDGQELIGKTISLHIKMSDADLYAYYY